MIEFGKSLRTTREAKGITIEQLAERTHMPAKTIRELENEDFSSFAAPIYGRGFVKLYCREVGLEPKPFIDEFMDIFTGNRDLTIRDREPVAPTEPVAPAPAAPAPAATAPAEPVEAAMPTPEAEATPNPGIELPPVTGAEPPEPTFTLSADEVKAPIPPPDAAVSRYANPIYDDPVEPAYARTFSIPPSVWRLAILGLAVAVLLWGAFVGLKALHRLTCGTAGSEANKVSASETVAPAETAPKPAATATDKPPATATKPASTRKPQKIPPLYIN